MQKYILFSRIYCSLIGCCLMYCNQYMFQYIAVQYIVVEYFVGSNNDNEKKWKSNIAVEQVFS